MEQLQFTAVHEDGQHLVLSSPDGTEFRLPIDERLRSALRSRGPAADVPATQLSPRDVQAMIRAGQTAEEVAEITGWAVDRVVRFEAPITAEREHVAGLARAAHVRGRSVEGVVPTLEARVLERLAARGVDPDNTSWDATRPAGGPWTVVVNFVAGQRQRAAAWRFEPADRTVEALDDEARWLSEDEQALPGSAAGRQLLGTHGASEEVDLVTSMRERSRTRSRRKKPAAPREAQGAAPAVQQTPDDVLPLEDVDAGQEGAPPADAAATEDRSATDGRTAAEDPTARRREGAAAGSDPEREASDRAASGSTKGRRSRTARSRAGRAKSPRPSPTPPEQPTTAAPPAPEPAAPADAGAGATSYEVELDFDENYEVDPRPQEATLADLFGPGDPAPDEVPADDYLDEDDFEDHGDDSDAPAAAAPTPPAVEPGSAPAAAEGLTFDNDNDDPDAGATAPEPADADADAAATAPEPAEPGDVEPEDAKPEDAQRAQAGGVGPTEVEDTDADASVGTTDEDAETADDTAADSSPARDSSQPGAKRRKDGRPGVPSWDDIMFGAKDRK